MNVETGTMTVSGAARFLGVHVNTVRAWTDQGRLPCLRVNARGDRRYRRSDLSAFLAASTVTSGPVGAFQSRLAPAGPRTRPIGLPERPAHADPADRARPVVPFPVGESGAATAERDPRILASVSGLAGTAAAASDLDSALRAAMRSLRDPRRFRMLAIGEWAEGRLVARQIEGIHRARAWWRELDLALAERACADGRQVAGVVERSGRLDDRRAPRTAGAVRIHTPIGSAGHAWGVLVAEVDGDRAADPQTLEQLAVTAGILELATRRDHARERGHATGDEHRWRAVAELGAALGARVELSRLLATLVERAVEPFAADGAIVVLGGRGGSREVTTSAGVDAALAGSVALATGTGPLHESLAGGRAAGIAEIGEDARTNAVAEVARTAGIRRMAVVGLGIDDGALALVRTAGRPWSDDELAMLESLAGQVTVAVRNARDLDRMSTWTAQLASIRRLGMRLDRLMSVTEIGQAICHELRELIAYDNVRVYRVAGQELLPVAWHGDPGPYAGEDGERLRLRVGEGITGWVARHGRPAIVADAARDPRARTMPGSPEVDESMLVAPMRDDEQVIGVIVLSRLGLDRFGADDLRYLEIYASMAAQAIVNADATDRLREQSRRLERQLETQRELLRVTESILSSLDPRRVVDEIAARLGALVPCDHLAVELDDPQPAGGVRLTEDRAGTWARIVAPLRRRDGSTGSLRLERRGRNARFEGWEVDLVTLFAGQVSIALSNAVAHREVEERAATDALTGLRNQGSFHRELDRAIARGVPFGLLMIDLDDFKSWNDTHGHEAGNRLLKAVAVAIGRACRESDLVFRYGGDEFSLILPESTPSAALEVAERLPRAVRAASHDRVSCSIGIAAFPADAADRDALILAADRACYVAKRAGGSRVAIAAEGLELADEIRPAEPAAVEPSGTVHAA